METDVKQMNKKKGWCPEGGARGHAGSEYQARSPRVRCLLDDERRVPPHVSGYDHAPMLALSIVLAGMWLLEMSLYSVCDGMPHW